MHSLEELAGLGLIELCETKTERLLIPGSKIAHEVRVYFCRTEQQLLMPKITKITPNYNYHTQRSIHVSYSRHPIIKLCIPHAGHIYASAPPYHTPRSAPVVSYRKAAVARCPRPIGDGGTTYRLTVEYDLYCKSGF